MRDRVRLLSCMAVALILSMAQPCRAQGRPRVEWLRSFGGVQDEHSSGVVQQAGGGYVVVGTSSSQTSTQVMLAAFDKEGAERWSRLIPFGDFSFGHAIQATRDGGFVVVGMTSAVTNPYSDVLLIKTDAEGEVTWARSFGGLAEDSGRAVVQLADGGYAVAGHTRSFGAGDNDLYLIRIDGDGKELWAQVFGGERQDRCYAIQETADGGLVLAGATRSSGAGGVDMYLVKTDAAGNEAWSRTFGGPGDDYANDVRETGDGGFILAGGMWERDDAHRPRVSLVRTDSEGTVVWAKAYLTPSQESAKSAIELAQGGFLALTSSGLLRVDEDGWYVWGDTWESLGGPERFDGWYIAWALQQTSDDGFVVTGSVDVDDDDSFDGFLLRLSPEDGALFMRGDTNADGELNIADAIWSILWLFGAKADLPCHDAVDANDDGAFNISDVITVLIHLFRDPAPLPPPFGACGADPTSDSLDCRTYRPCP